MTLPEVPNGAGTRPASSANSKSSPPNSDQAKWIQMLVDRAAELVNSKGKEAFSEFRRPGSVERPDRYGRSRRLEGPDVQTL
jgi:hypothetical protein